MLIYRSADGSIKIDVRMGEETVWLTQDQMAALFGKAKSTINEHLKNIFSEGELVADSVIRNFRTTAADGKGYDTKAEKTVEFFKIVQNKLLWAISSQTAAELIAHRADARLPMMGMTSCDKSDPRRITKADAATAKNYLTEDEMKDLGLLVEQYLAFAESQARRQVPMYMADWIKKLNDILVINGRELLEHAGQISRKVAESIAAQQLDAYKGRLREKERRASLAELEADLQAAAKKQP